MSLSRMRHYLYQLENIESILCDLYLKYEKADEVDKTMLQRQAERVLRNKEYLEDKIKMIELQTVARSMLK